MTTPIKDEILELGETYVTLLKSPICPAEVRTAIIKHLDFVRQQLDMTNPELVRSVFSFLAETATLPQPETNSQEAAAQAAAAANMLNAAVAMQAATQAPPVQAPVQAPVPTAVKLEEPVASVAPVAAPVQTQPVVAHPVSAQVPAQPIMTPEPVKATSGNLASRLSASGDDREDVLG